MKKELAQQIASRIMEELEKGIIPWRRPWTGTANGPVSHATGRAYSLLNQFLLGAPGEYLTFAQAKKEGGHVRKGEKGKTIYLWKQVKVEDEDKDGKPVEKLVPMLKGYTVFHVSQCEGIKEKWNRPAAAAPCPMPSAESVLSSYLTRSGVAFFPNRKQNKAYYLPQKDEIHMPALENFPEPEKYYQTAFHEAVHSTGHQSRLNRFTESKPAAFGDQSYSKEELVAEIGAAVLVNHCGIETKSTFQNTAAYCQSWLNVLKNDPAMIVFAAGKADKAVQLILSGEETNPEE